MASSSAQNIADDWVNLDFDVDAIRRNFDVSKQQAAKFGNDYRIEFTDDDASCVWANRELLAVDSTFFREKLSTPNPTSEGLKLGGVLKVDFLDYVYSISPMILKLSLARVGRILILAKRFQNEALVARCEKFLRDFTTDVPSKQREHLVEVDRQEISDVFKSALLRMKRCDLKLFKISTIEQFSQENLRFFLEHLVDKKPVQVIQQESTSFETNFKKFVSKLGSVKSFLLPKKEAAKKSEDFKFLLDIATAALHDFDCTILVEGHETMPIYVKKSILAKHSEYFKKLFLVEANEDIVTLKDIDFDEFLEYLANVYPSNARITMGRVGALLSMAERFGNEVLLKQSEDFLLQNYKEDGVDKNRILYLADQFNLEQLFTLTLGELEQDIRDIDLGKVIQFRAENLRKFLEHCFKCL